MKGKTQKNNPIFALLLHVASVFLAIMIMPVALMNALHELAVNCTATYSAFKRLRHEIIGDTDGLEVTCEDEWKNDLRDPSTNVDCLWYRIAYICGKYWLPKPYNTSYKTFLQSIIYEPVPVPLNVGDRTFLLEENDLYVTMAFVFSKDVTFDRFKNHFVRRWLSWSSKFRCTIRTWNGRLCWVHSRGKFDILRHIIQDSSLPADNYHAAATRLYNEKLPDEHPQWKAVFTQTKDAHIVLLKFHHTYSDGSGTMTAIVDRLGDNPVSTAELPDKYKVHIPYIARICYYIFYGCIAAWEGLNLYVQYSYQLNKPKTLITSQEYSLESSPNVESHLSMPIEFIVSDLKALNKAISKRMNKNLTINDIMIYLLANAYSQLKYPPRLKSVLNNEVQAIASENVSRGNIRAQEVAEPDSEWDETANLIVPFMCRTSRPLQLDNATSMVATSINLPNPTWTLLKSGEDDVNRTVRNISSCVAGLEKLKHRNMGMIVYMVFYILNRSLPNAYVSRIYRKLYSKIEYCSTNVAAPSISADFCGSDVDTLVFWPAVHENCTVGTSWVSLGNRIQVLVIVGGRERESVNKICPNVGRNIADTITSLMSFELLRLNKLFT